MDGGNFFLTVSFIGIRRCLRHSTCDRPWTFYFFGRTMMKSIKHIAVVAALIATPFAAFAQSSAQSPDSLSRAQVKQDQIQVEQAGYNNSVGDQASYPREAQAAEARIGAQQVREEATGGYGGVMPGSSASGVPDQPMQPAHTGGAPGTKSVYFGN
jgi:hypothetical protein